MIHLDGENPSQGFQKSSLAFWRNSQEAKKDFESRKMLQEKKLKGGHWFDPDVGIRSASCRNPCLAHFQSKK
jgi:hypothetical protein